MHRDTDKETRGQVLPRIMEKVRKYIRETRPPWLLLTSSPEQLMQVRRAVGPATRTRLDRCRAYQCSVTRLND